jgi:glycine betaine/proline transport system ATP-binding protein
MQQRVGLARALATDADVLLMDEAFSALDPLIRSEMQEQLVGLQRDLEKTVIFITHDLNEAMFLGDRIAIMKDGRIVQIGTTEEILQDPADDYVRAFVQDVDRSRVLTAEAVMEEPVAKILRREGPKAALLEMKARQTTGLLIVDERKRLVGGTTDDAVVQAVRSGQHQLEPVIAREDVATVTPETPLVDLLVPSAENRLPLAVVDENDRLLGVIPRITLLNALGGTDAGNRGSDDAAAAAEPTDAPSAETSVLPSDDEGEGVRS